MAKGTLDLGELTLLDKSRFLLQDSACKKGRLLEPQADQLDLHLLPQEVVP